MTYPPQQPGPYGGQPDPYGQQPGWQQGGYGQPDWGQQPNYGGFPGGPGMPPPKKKTGLIVGLVIAAVLVVGGGVTAIILLTKDDDKSGGSASSAQTTEAGKSGDQSSPDALVERVIKAVDAKDSKAANETLCDPSSKSPAFQLDVLPADVTLQTSLNGKITERGEEATAKLGIKVTENGKSRLSRSMNLTMKKDADKWCVSRAQLSAGSGSGGSSSSSRPTS